MSELPADIKEKAFDAAFDCGPRSSFGEVASRIAGAILAERERCAKIAEEAAENLGERRHWSEIAAAIRKETE